MNNNSTRCLYKSGFKNFISENTNSIFGILCEKYHGEALTTTREAWKNEILIMKKVLSPYENEEGQIIFEYDIPRLGKRIDVVLLFRGIIFCLEFKVGESKILEADIDQVLDYALDLKNFHKFSQDKVIVPILIATKVLKSSTDIQMSVYDDKVVNPLIAGETGIFDLIAKTGNISEHDMFNTFNMGVGMSVVVAEKDAKEALNILKANGEDAYIIGKIIKSDEKIKIC